MMDRRFQCVILSFLFVMTSLHSLPVLTNGSMDGMADDAGAGFGFFDYAGACYDITTDLDVSTENVSFTSGSCVMSANITVQPGYTFTLTNTTLTLQDPAFGNLTVTVYGHIWFNNATFTKPAMPTWSLAAHAGSEVDINNHSLLEGGKELVLISPSSNTSISNSTFRNFKDDPSIATKFLDLTNSASVRIRDNVFDGAWGAISMRNGYNNFIVNNTFRNLTAYMGDDAAVLANNESGVIVYNNRFIDSATGVTFNTSTYADLMYSTFDNCTTDVILNGSSIVYTLQNNDTKSIIRDNASLFRPFRYVSVEADWESDGDPVAGANIIFSNVTGAAQVMTTTDGVGQVDIVEVVYEDVARDYVINHTPFNVSLVAIVGPHTYNANVTQDLSANTSVNIVVDDVDPVLNVARPSNGLVTNVRSLFVNGTTDVPGAKPPNIITVEAWGTFSSVNMSSGGAFEANVTALEEGTNLINITATDQAGNSVTMNRTVIVDWTLPNLTLHDPKPNMLTNMPVITLNGTTDIDASLTYRVSNATSQGAEISLFHAINGAFMEDIVIPEGLDRINVTARDPAGNSVSALVDVMADFTAPDIMVLKPTSTEVLTNEDVLRITGVLSDDVVRFYIEGIQQEINASRYFDVNVSLEFEGLNMVGLTAFDAAGNIFSVILNVTLDILPPILHITEPAEGALVSTSSINIRGTTDLDAYVTINGLHAGLDYFGMFDLDVTLVEGDNDVVIKATDPAGNMAEDVLKVTRDTVSPPLELLSPADGTVTNEYPVNVAIRSEPNATVYIDEYWATTTNIYDDYAIYAAAVYMEEGENIIEIWVTDTAGNGAHTFVTVFLDTYIGLYLDLMPSIVSKPTYTVSGYTDRDANVTVNGHDAKVDGTGYYSYTTTLTSKHTTFTIVARDQAGNREERYWDVSFTEAPGETDGAGGSNSSWGADPWCLMILIINIVIFVAMYVARKAQRDKGQQRPPQPGGGWQYGGGG